MKKINEFYDIGEVNNIVRLEVKCVNQLYIVSTEHNKYLLKIYIPSYNKTVAISLLAQQMVCENLCMAPNIIRNRKNELLSKSNNIFFSLQKYVECSEFLLSINSIDVYMDAVSKLHKLLNQSFDFILKKETKENLERVDILKNIKTAREQYKKLDKQNQAYSQLLDLREKFTESLPAIKYSVNYPAIIHGDIRPSNVFIFCGKINFIDFDYIAYGDLIYELTSSAALLSNYSEEICRLFWKQYAVSHHLRLSFEEAYMHLLSYYIKSNFPLSVMEYESKEQIDKMSIERIKLLEFCHKISAK